MNESSARRNTIRVVALRFLLSAILCILPTLGGYTQESSVRVNARRNTEVRAGTHTVMFKNILGLCETASFKVRLEEAPNNGSVRFVSTKERWTGGKIQYDYDSSTSSSDRNSLCYGEVIPVIAEYYKPFPGFTGVDVYRVSQITSDGVFTSTVIVTVH